MRQGIAHCFVHENRVVEEWICRDELALIRQLGLGEIALARQLAAREATPAPYGHGEVARLRGQTTPAPVEPRPAGMDEIEYFVRRAFHEIWNWRLFNKIDDYYAPTYRCGTAGSTWT